MCYKQSQALLYSDTARGLTPALMRFHNLRDQIEMCDTLADLGEVEIDLQVAEMEYGGFWEEQYAPVLARLFIGRRNNLVKEKIAA